MARLLTPDDFGLLALSLALFEALRAFSNFGFDLALIRKDGLSKDDLDTAWTFGAIRGAIVAVILALVAPWCAEFFGDTRLRDVLYLLAGLAFFSGLQNIGVIEFQKDLRFDLEFRLSVSSQTIAILTSVALALFWRNYWALVIGYCAGGLGRVVLSYAMHSYRPHLIFAKMARNYRLFLLGDE